MRILHVTHEIPPHETAGTAIYTLNIARAQARDHDVFVFARLQDPGRPAHEISSEMREGLTVRYLNVADIEWSPFEKSYRDERAERIFRDFLDEVEPDVIHFQHVLGFGGGILAVARELGVPIVFTLHDFWLMCPMGQRMCYTDEVICDPIDFGKCGPCVFGDGWKEVGERERQGPQTEGDDRPTLNSLYLRRYRETPGRFARRPRAWLWALRRLPAARRNGAGGQPAPALPFTDDPFAHRFAVLRQQALAADLLITPSAFLRDQFIEHFDLDPERIIHSANGMDFSYVERREKSASERLRFGFVGSIIRTKGVHVAVDAFLDLAREHEDVELHVHGAPNRWSGDYLEALKQRAATRPGGERVHFRGRFDNRRIGEVLSDIDVLIVPSIWFENAPLTLNEAAMTGTPIVVSDRGGMLEFARDNAYGRTFELGNPQSLAAVLRELAEDRARIPALAGNPPPIKPVEDNARELLGIYAELVAGGYAAPSIEEQTRTRGGCVHAV